MYAEKICRLVITNQPPPTNGNTELPSSAYVPIRPPTAHAYNASSRPTTAQRSFQSIQVHLRPAPVSSTSTEDGEDTLGRSGYEYVDDVVVISKWRVGLEAPVWSFASLSRFASEVGEIEVGLDVVKPRKVTGSVMIS